MFILNSPRLSTHLRSSSSPGVAEKHCTWRLRVLVPSPHVGSALGFRSQPLCGAGSWPRQLQRKKVPALGRVVVFGFWLFPPFCGRISSGLNSSSHQQFDADCDSGRPCFPHSLPAPSEGQLSALAVDSPPLADGCERWTPRPGLSLQTRVLVSEQREVGALCAHVLHRCRASLWRGAKLQGGLLALP